MPELATLTEAVARLGLRGPKQLYRLIEKGAPKPRAGKRGSARYDVEAIRVWMERRQERNQPALDLQAERAKLARVDRHLKSLRIRQLKGVLIPRESTDLIYSRVQASVRAAVLRLPVDAIQRGIPGDYEETLREIAEGILASLTAATWEDVEGAA